MRPTIHNFITTADSFDGYRVVLPIAIAIVSACGFGIPRFIAGTGEGRVEI